jgi:heptosyltransferase-2
MQNMIIQQAPQYLSETMKILILRLSSMGDVVLTTSILSAIRKKHPEAQIDFVVKEQFAPLMEHHPAITTLHRIVKEPGALKSLKKLIQTSGYTAILDLHNTFRSFYLKFNCGVPIVRTLSKGYFRRFLLVSWKINLYGDKPESIIDRYAQTAGEFADSPVPHFPELFIPETIQQQVASMPVRKNALRIVLVPGSAHLTKEWPVDRFAETASLLSSRYKALIIVLGGKSEIPAGEIICAKVGTSCQNLTGKTSLLETAGIIKQCDLIISVDTGCMHIGWAFQKKMVCIFGSTVRELGYFPDYKDAVIVENHSLSCRPCSHNGLKKCPKKHFRCMNEITTEMVTCAAEKLLKQRYDT